MLLAAHADNPLPDPADWGMLEKANNLRRPRLQRAALRLASKARTRKPGAFADFGAGRWVTLRQHLAGFCPARLVRRRPDTRPVGLRMTWPCLLRVVGASAVTRRKGILFEKLREGGPGFAGGRSPPPNKRIAWARPAIRNSPCLTSGPTFVTLRPWKRTLSASHSGQTPRRGKSDFLSVYQ
jgi:hypothetical protein